MREGKATTVVRSDTTVFCGDCGCDPVTDDPWRWARRHAEKTGHIPTVHVQYDIHKKEAGDGIL